MSLITNNIYTRSDLIEYVLRKMGHGVGHNVDITELQMHDCIDSVMRDFLEGGYDAVEQKYYILDLVKDQFEYEMPTNILDLVDVIGGDSYGVDNFDNAFIANQLHIYNNSDFISNTLDYHIFQMYIQTQRNSLKVPINFHYNAQIRKLTFFEDLMKNRGIKKLACRVYTIAGETQVEWERLYSHNWVILRTEYEFMRQWETNLLLKYDGGLYDGNIKLNADLMNKRIEELKIETDQQLDEVYGEFPSPQLVIL